MAGRKRSLKRLAAALLLLFACALAGASPQEQSTGTPQAHLDLSALMPPLRGLDFDEPRPDLNDRGPVAVEPASEEGLALIAEALAWLGTPYRLGGFSKAGVDCSGFLYNVLKSTVPELGPFPRRSDEYAGFGAKSEEIQPGDILLFAREGDIYHVGIALSEGTFIHSASEGGRTGVIISSLYEGNWRRRLYGVRHLAF
ncbi:C40 family peptidase [bacterium]|nr:C40 family peptidase [bacterium]